MANDFLEDVLADFADGVNQDPPPLKLARTQLSNAVNLTVRGQYARPRPPYNKIQLSSAFDVAATGLLQAAAYYKPDSAPEWLMIAVSGNLWKIELDGTVTQVNTPATAQNPFVPQHWLFQAEKWLVWNDNISLPVFYDGNTTRRSAGLTVAKGAYTGTIVATISSTDPNYQSFQSSHISPYPILTLQVSPNYSGIVGDHVQFNVTTQFQPSSLPSTVNMLPFEVLGISGDQIQVRYITTNGQGWPYSTFTPGVKWKNVIQAAATIEQISNYSSVTTSDITIPNPTNTGDSFTIPLAVPYTGQVNDYIQVGGPSLNLVFQVTAIGASDVTATSYNVSIPGGFPGSITIPSGSLVRTVTVAATSELPAGNMGAYGRGRIVMALPDRKTFIIGDLFGGSAGTPAENARDAVLHTTENKWLRGGGLFGIPGSFGDITSITFTATLDTSLGQGACQIGTPTHMFGLNLPTDRTVWADLTDPLLPVSLIGYGPMSQTGTILCNSDIIFRSIIGIGSLIMARRDFSQYGNVPMSQEVDATLSQDDTAMLQFVSAIDFDNRVLMTAGPHSSEQGIYFDKLIVLNNDPVSSLRGKAPSVYDGYWTGLNVMALVTGLFSSKDRAFAFTRSDEGKIELHEIRKSNTEEIYDDGTERIALVFETCALFRENQGRNRKLLRLVNGEICVDQLEGAVDFYIYYRPDQYPCWTLWNKWSECAQTAKGPLPIPENPETLMPQFRPRMGLGTPSGTPCDASTNRPMVEAYTFPMKIVIVGQCRFLGMTVQATVAPQPKLAPPKCCAELVDPTTL